MIINIETIMRYFEAEARPIYFEEALAAKKAQGVKLGRPAAKLPIHTIALMRVSGKTWGTIAKELDISINTIKNHRREICREVEEVRKVVQ